jgi:hypothetical protein
VQLQPLESLDNRVKVGGAGGVDRNVNLLRSPSHGDDEVQAPETHDHARGPSSSVVGHPKPDEVVETHKAPYLARQLSVFRVAEHLNYSSSSALVIAIQPILTQHTSNGTTHWSVRSPPDTTTIQQDRSRFTLHEGEFTITRYLTNF